MLTLSPFSSTFFFLFALFNFYLVILSNQKFFRMEIQFSIVCCCCYFGLFLIEKRDCRLTKIQFLEIILLDYQLTVWSKFAKFSNHHNFSFKFKLSKWVYTLATDACSINCTNNGENMLKCLLSVLLRVISWTYMNVEEKRELLNFTLIWTLIVKFMRPP
jgi:hypothetical protein